MVAETEAATELALRRARYRMTRRDHITPSAYRHSCETYLTEDESVASDRFIRAHAIDPATAYVHWDDPRRKPRFGSEPVELQGRARSSHPSHSLPPIRTNAYGATRAGCGHEGIPGQEAACRSSNFRRLPPRLPRRETRVPSQVASSSSSSALTAASRPKRHGCRPPPGSPPRRQTARRSSIPLSRSDWVKATPGGKGSVYVRSRCEAGNRATVPRLLPRRAYFPLGVLLHITYHPRCRRPSYHTRRSRRLRRSATRLGSAEAPPALAPLTVRSSSSVGRYRVSVHRMPRGTAAAA